MIKSKILMRELLSGEEPAAEEESLETYQLSTITTRRAMLNLVPVDQNPRR